MAWTDLPTNYKDAVWNGNRKYRQITNSDGTVSFEDVTVYSQKDDSFFGATDANQMNAAMNELAENMESVEDNATKATNAAATATEKATAAANSASAAASSKSAAATSATNAANSATTATEKATAAGNAQTAAANSAAAAAESATEAQESAALTAALLYNNAGAHNAIYRGKNLGTSVTAAQWAAIAAGTFEDMYIGDYWVIGGVTYRIAAFDYYYKTGDTSCDTHHVTLVPDSNMYTHVMNDTNVTTGAYVGSKMYTTGLSAAKSTINNAFGSAHILNHRQYLKNAVTNGYESAGSWYDSTVELMTEQNAYGGKVFANCTQGTNWAAQYTVDKSQYPLFAHRPDMISNRAWFWLRDVASAASFCLVGSYGFANGSSASNALGVRPAFSIKS